MKLLTTVDVARRAGLTTDAIRKAVSREQLRALRAESGIYIYREVDVDRWLARRRRAIEQIASTGDAA